MFHFPKSSYNEVRPHSRSSHHFDSCRQFGTGFPEMWLILSRRWFFPASAFTEMCSRLRLITWVVQWRPRSSVKGVRKKNDEMKRGLTVAPCSVPIWADSKSWNCLRPHLLYLPASEIDTVTVAWCRFWRFLILQLPLIVQLFKGGCF